MEIDSNIVELDVRPYLRKKVEPFQIISARISYCPTKPILREVDLYRICGQEVLFNCNSIDMSELEIYMAKGFLKKSELSLEFK